MDDIAVSQITTARWELSQELSHCAALGFAALAVWRPKLADVGAAAAAAALERFGVRSSSLTWAGGFTGGDGRSFAECVADALEAIDDAGTLGAPVLVLHSGCRGGHTRSHAFRLLDDALEALLPAARRGGVTLALAPMHPVSGCSFLSRLDDALDLVERRADPAVRLALDLWHFADDPAIVGLLPRLAEATAVVQVADRCGPPTPGGDRLPAGHGSLDLEPLVAGLRGLGFGGDVEFDPVGETVEVLGYPGVLQESRLVAGAWGDRMAAHWHAAHRHDPGLDGRHPVGGPHFRRAAAAGSRRSQASSHTVSRG